jgi:hypothetical protein
MKNLKHSKFKNTGFIFEVLTRFAMREALEPSVPQKAIRIIKKHFHPKSELVKELRYYQTLGQGTNHNPDELFKLTLEGKQQLNQKNLSVEKYELVKSINKAYNQTVFFETKTPNYKVNASIYKLFEHNPSSNPDDYLNTKKFILEHLSGKKPETINEVEQQVRELDPDIRKLSLKILIERFNQKYQGLNEKQKTLLVMYINEDSRRTSFKDYIFNEITTITKELKRLGSNVKNEVSRIKLNETINLAQNIINSKTLKEEHLTAMLKYYELIEELKR